MATDLREKIRQRIKTMSPAQLGQCYDALFSRRCLSCAQVEQGDGDLAEGKNFMDDGGDGLVYCQRYEIWVSGWHNKNPHCYEEVDRD